MSDPGVRASRRVELINADPLLTAAEADAFTELGIVGRAQLGRMVEKARSHRAMIRQFRQRRDSRRRSAD
jgi:hypothetical protein